MKTLPRHTDLKAGGESLDLDAPRAATEWEEALIKHGIKQAPERVETEDQKQLKAIEELQSRDTHANKSLAQLDELEDDLEEDTLAAYRARRVKELKEKAKRDKFGAVFQIHEPDYKREVTDASAEPGVWVVVHLFSYAVEECSLLSRCMDALAAQFKAVKFVKIKATEAIPNWPESKCPCILLYTKGDMVKELIGPGLFGGSRMTPKSVEWGLAAFGVLETELEENPLSAVRTTTLRIDKGRNAASESDEDD